MRRAVILGGYGLIGAACMRALSAAGWQVTGIGRNGRAARVADPAGDWVIRDIPGISPQEWRDLLAGVDLVVNASGVLQDGGKDDLEAIHVTAISHLVAGMADLPVRLVQISAAGVSEAASTEFFRSKARGDAIIGAKARDWVILRPTLVLAPDAYGGTALLRAASALPVILPEALPEAEVQTVYIGDVTHAIVLAGEGRIASGTIADLTEPGSHRFADLLARMRQWQGWPEARLRPRVPAFAIRGIGRIADLLGHLGWRSPLRSTALHTLEDGIHGDPGAWQRAGGAPCRSLEETLRAMPATRQDRAFARAYLILPLAIATLALFWSLSGLIALLDPARAMLVLTERGAPGWFSGLAVVGGAFADLALGLAILHRPWTRAAALGMIALSSAYLLGSVIAAPGLWADPLGPMVKVLPGMALAAAVWLLMDER